MILIITNSKTRKKVGIIKLFSSCGFHISNSKHLLRKSQVCKLNNKNAMSCLRLFTSSNKSFNMLLDVFDIKDYLQKVI